MKKLLIMASLFWPQKNSGGPPISIMNLVMSIKDHFDIYIISKNHELNDDKPLDGIRDGWNVFPFGQAYYVPKGQHTYANIYKLIEEVSPDVIYQNSFFSFDDLFPVLRYKKRHQQVKVIVAPRGEFYPERLQCGYLKKTLYGKFLRYSGLLKDVYFQGTGEEECAQEQAFLGIAEDHLLNIQNLAVVTSAGVPCVEKHAGELKLVYIARVHPTKNTLKAIEWLSKMDGNIAYDIYGSIENEAYWKDCEKAMASLPDHIAVRYRGSIDHDRVAEVLSQYHAYYMPTAGENFGHSIVESMLVGRPVVISDQTPWTDVHGNGGYALPLTREEAFVSALRDLVDMDQATFDDACQKAKAYIEQKLDTPAITQQYIQAFNGDV